MGSNSQIQCEIAVVMVQLRDGDPAIAHIYPISRHTSEVLESQAIEFLFGVAKPWLGRCEPESHGSPWFPTEDGRDGQQENAKLPP